MNRYLLVLLLTITACVTAPVPSPSGSPSPALSVSPVSPVPAPTGHEPLPASSPSAQATLPAPSPSAQATLPAPTLPVDATVSYYAWPPADFVPNMNPACTGYSWKNNRGVAPKGYLPGLATVEQRSLARIGSAIGGPIGDTKHDALAWYAPELKALGIPTDTYANRIRATYLILAGLGMMESSGNYLEGWDTTNAGTVTSTSAEAGLFQASYDSLKNDERQSLYTAYRTVVGPSVCMVDVFKPGAYPPKGQTAVIVGTGPGAQFQTFTKQCPAFATEYAAVLLRILGGSEGEFGPIQRKKIELIKACYQ